MPQTQENQWLMPLAASIVCREANLPPEQSIALTAAAWLIDGPLALAPAIVAVERSRSEPGAPGQTGKGKTEPAAAAGDPIYDKLVYLPKVEKRSRDRAITLLHERGLRARVVLEPSTAGMKGKVIRQFPPFVDGGKLDPGTHITLHVGTGPTDPRETPAAPVVATQTVQADGAKV